VSLCVVCQTATVERPNVCAHDRNRIPGILRDLGQAYAALLAEPEPAEPGLLVIDDGTFDGPYVYDVVPLPAGPTRATAGSAPVSGSREAPVPVSLDLVDLTAPARAGSLLPHANADLHQAASVVPRTKTLERHTYGARWVDQVGHLSVATELDFWVVDWIEARGQREHRPAPNVPDLIRWLGDRVDDACDHNGAIDEFATKVSELLWTCRRLAGELPPLPEKCHGIPCSRCDMLDLWRHPGSQWRAECGTCGRLYDEDDYERWVRMLSAGLKESA
jgi:hypothetical protein